MDYCKYLRDVAADFENLGLTAPDPLVAQDFLELAMACKEKAARMARRADRPAAVYLFEG
jgi:hypothetical protein